MKNNNVEENVNFNGTRPDEIEVEVAADPKCFSIMVGINGHPVKGDIKCDREFSDKDLLHVAWKIEAAVFESLYERGCTNEQVIEQIAIANFFRREYLGKCMNIASNGNEDVVRATMEADLIESYEEFLENEDKKNKEKAKESAKPEGNTVKFVKPDMD